MTLPLFDLADFLSDLHVNTNNLSLPVPSDQPVTCHSSDVLVFVCINNNPEAGLGHLLRSSSVVLSLLDAGATVYISPSCHISPSQSRILSEQFKFNFHQVSLDELPLSSAFNRIVLIVDDYSLAQSLGRCHLSIHHCSAVYIYDDEQSVIPFPKSVLIRSAPGPLVVSDSILSGTQFIPLRKQYLTAKPIRRRYDSCLNVLIYLSASPLYSA